MFKTTSYSVLNVLKNCWKKIVEAVIMPQNHHKAKKGTKINTFYLNSHVYFNKIT